jgi:hypothetical protein
MSDDDFDSIWNSITSGANYAPGEWANTAYDWDNYLGGIFEINTGNLTSGQAGYNWTYYSDGTAISPEGVYYFDGKKVYDPADQGSFISMLTTAAKKLPEQAMGALKNALFKPDGSINPAAIGTLAAAAYGFLGGGNEIKTGGYNRPVPKMDAVRERVPYEYDPNRRPGEGGRRYFSDIQFVPEGGDLAAARTAAQEQAQGIAALPPKVTPVQQEVASFATPWANTQQPNEGVAMAAGGQVPNFQGTLENNGFVVPGDVVRHADPAGMARKEAGLQALHRQLGAQAIRGPGDAMSDSIPTTIEGRQPAAVANGEAYVPRRMVEKLGNGNPKKGAQQLYDMMERLRLERTGSKKQINPDNPQELVRAYQGGQVKRFNTGGTPTTAGTTAASTSVQPVSYGTSSTSTLSPWVGDYVTDALGQARALANTPYQAYEGPLTAGPSALQEQAFAGASQIAKKGFTPTNFTASFGAPAAYEQQQFTNQFSAPGAYKEVQFSNQFTAPGAYDAAQFTSQDMSQSDILRYMNPYLNLSLQPQLQEAQRQAEIQRLADAARLVNAGAYGGSRQAIMEAEGARNLLDIQGQIAGRGYDTAYAQALDQANTDRTQSLRAQELTEQSRQFGAGQAMTAAERAAQYGLEALRGQASERQFSAGQAMTAAERAAQYGLEAQRGQAGESQFAYSQAMRAAEAAAEDGRRMQELKDASRRFSAEFGLSSLGMLSNMGAIQRGIEAEGIAADRAQFEEERDWAYKMPQYQLGMLSGIPIGASSVTPNTTGLSSLQAQIGDLMGLYDLLGGATNKPATSTTPPASTTT